MQQYYVSDEEIDALWEYFVDQEAATPCVVCGRRVADLSDAVGFAACCQVLDKKDDNA